MQKAVIELYYVTTDNRFEGPYYLARLQSVPCVAISMHGETLSEALEDLANIIGEAEKDGVDFKEHITVIPEENT